MAKIKEIVDIPTVEVEKTEVETVPVETTEVSEEKPKKERKTLKQRGQEFAEKHPVAVRRAKKIGKVVLIGGAAVAGALYGMSKMGQKSEATEEESEATDDTIPFDGDDLEVTEATAEE